MYGDIQTPVWVSANGPRHNTRSTLTPSAPISLTQISDSLQSGCDQVVEGKYGFDVAVKGHHIKGRGSPWERLAGSHTLAPLSTGPLAPGSQRLSGCGAREYLGHDGAWMLVEKQQFT